MKPARKGLGKGLSALIPEDEQINFGEQSLGEILELKLTDVFANPDQPRRIFAEDALEQLSESIKVHGVVQPILVQKSDKGFMIIAGERRWRASQKAGLDRIPAIVKAVDELKLAQISLIENLQRENLSDIEEAKAYQILIDRFSLKHDEIADSVGKSRSYIANTLRLLKLDQRVQQMILDGKISGGHGRVLLREESVDAQLKWAQTVIEKSMSVRELENLFSKPKKAKSVDIKIKALEHEIRLYEQELKDLLGTKVQINSTSGNKGKIQIEYYGVEEFERIMNLLKK